jgi:predicted NBD/HSP70 family sugar kinase
VQHERGLGIPQVRGFAVGIPAPLTLDGRIASSLFLRGWTTVNVHKEIRAVLDDVYKGGEARDVKLLVENDANLGAHAERRRLGPECRNLAYVKLSTGVGMGLLLNGAIYRGQRGVAAEFGHVSVPAEALARTGLTQPESLPRPCPRCQKADCVEILAGAPQLVERLRRQDEHYDEALTIHQVIDNVRESKTKHPKCLQALVDAGTWIGFALADQMTMLDLDAIVIGGLLSRAGDALMNPITDAIAVHSVGLSEAKIVPLDADRITEVELEGAVALALSATELPYAD